MFSNSGKAGILAKIVKRCKSLNIVQFSEVDELVIPSLNEDDLTILRMDPLDEREIMFILDNIKN